MFIRIAIYSIAAMLIGAHFFRAGNFTMVVVSVVAPFAFFYRRQLSLVVLQALAYGAAATWLYTAWQLVEMRRFFGQKWAMAAVILGAVALYSLLAGLMLNSRVMREHYER